MCPDLTEVDLLLGKTCVRLTSDLELMTKSQTAFDQS